MVALLSFLILSISFISSSRAGNTTCADSGLDWYTNVAGETPCRTYERLRQICNSAYQVGTLSTSTPGDRCDEQVPDCCCNSISFALSMLCLNCQQGIGQGSGFDAGVGAYQIYLENGRTTFCSPNTNQSLPTSIQTAVCNNEIRIYDALYSLFWGDGAWFYEYTSQTITKDIASTANNTFTHCNSTLIQSTSSSSQHSGTATSSSTSTSTSSSSPATSAADTNASTSLGSGPVAGIAVGAAVGVLAVALLLWFFCWKRRKSNTRAYTGQTVIDIDPFLNSRENRSNDSVVQPYSFTSISNPTYSESGSGSFAGYGVGYGSASMAGPGPVESTRPSHSNSAPSYDFSSNSSFSALTSADAIASAGANPSAQNQSATLKASLLSSPLQGTNVDSSSYITRGRSDSIRKRPLPNQPFSSTYLSPEEELPETTSISMAELSSRHTDAGPVPATILERHNSGRLPPAYGEQFG